MTVTTILNWIAFVILAIGGLNWGLVGIFNFNLVSWIFGGYNALNNLVDFITYNEQSIAFF